jgi:hypothetical protein
MQVCTVIRLGSDYEGSHKTLGGLYRELDDPVKE